MWNLWESNAT